MKWSYGNAWEAYPIENNEVWGYEDNRVQVLNWMVQELPEYIKNATLFYCDPPWNLSNINSFYTKASEQQYETSFEAVASRLFMHVETIHPEVCYLEIGKQNVDLFMAYMQKTYKNAQLWEITYYNKHRCFLIRGSDMATTFDFTGKDDKDIPLLACSVESQNVVADLCTGRGLTAIAAFKTKKTFVGTELNKRRLAVAIKRVNKLGGAYARL
jgi:hypothetical protein